VKYSPKEVKGNVNISRTSPLRELFLLLGGVLGIIVLVYIALGLAVDLIVPHLPPGIEQNLGRIYSRIYYDKDRTPAEIRLQKILDELVEVHPVIHGRQKPPFNVKVHLSAQSTINAMALPGGNIVIFTGLIKEVESQNELDFILAHELGHLANRDHLRGLGRGLVLTTISAILLGKDSSVTGFLTNSLINVEMKFSQHQETQADLWALDALNRKYGHVSGAVDFFGRISKNEKRGRLLSYFATHPYPENRIANLEDQIQKKGFMLLDKNPLDKEFLIFNRPQKRSSSNKK
jgi:predicted Zn-dependent protease